MIDEYDSDNIYYGLTRRGYMSLWDLESRSDPPGDEPDRNFAILADIMVRDEPDRYFAILADIMVRLDRLEQMLRSVTAPIDSP